MAYTREDILVAISEFKDLDDLRSARKVAIDSGLPPPFSATVLKGRCLEPEQCGAVSNVSRRVGDTREAFGQLTAQSFSPLLALTGRLAAGLLQRRIKDPGAEVVKNWAARFFKRYPSIDVA